jgi:hypothetical protein
MLPTRLARRARSPDRTSVKGLPQWEGRVAGRRGPSAVLSGTWLTGEADLDSRNASLP